MSNSNFTTPSEVRDPHTGSNNEPLPMRDFAHSLPMALLSARELVMSRFRPMLREYGLTEQQWRVLRALVETNNITVTALAKRSYILSPSLSRILHNLAEQELIQRHSVAADQRRSQISLTQKGRRLFATIAPRSEAHYANIEASFGKRKLIQLHLLLADLDSSLSPDPQIDSTLATSD